MPLRIIHGGQVEDAVKLTLQTWLSTLLAEVEREAGLTPGHVRRPTAGAYVRTTDEESIDPKHLPQVAIVSDGFADEPYEHEDGMDAWFAVSAVFYAKGKDRDDALDNARMLTAAAREVLRKYPSLGDFAQSVRILDEGYGVIDARRERTYAGGEVVFAVLVSEVGSNEPGPAIPDPPATYPEHPDAPEADLVTVTTDRMESP